MDSDPAGSAMPPSCRLTRDSAAIITSVDDGIGPVLGWTPDDLIGRPSTSLIHPEDQPTAVAAWFDMLAEPGCTRIFRGRYRSADGSWRWLEVLNENHLDDSDEPHVVTTLMPVTVHEVNIEEELRARKQMLAMLADALPVGIFQFDADLHVTFANDRLSALLGADSFATLGAAFGGLTDDAATAFERATAQVLAGELVDGLELHMSDHPSGRSRVFEVTLRGLTASDGTINGAIGCLSDVTDRVRIRQVLEQQATRDALTGCLNRNAILARLDGVLESLTAGDGVAVLFVDLDDFKSTNDDFGHAAGDAVLVEASRRLAGCLRLHDALGRLGGDEFLAVCPSIASVDAARELAERVRAAVDGLARVDGHEVKIAAAVGLAWTGSPMPRDLLVSEADHAMYEHKRRRRDIAA